MPLKESHERIHQFPRKYSKRGWLLGSVQSVGKISIHTKRAHPKLLCCLVASNLQLKMSR